MFPTTLAILGSTGSIGCNTLRVVEALGATFSVRALAAGRNMKCLAGQIARHSPALVSVESEECAAELDRLLHERGISAAVRPRVLTGEAGLIAAATDDEVGCVVGATVGAVGLVPTLRALAAGKRVALANKEPLVMAGELMMQAARASGADLLPIDSEHNALHQCLRGEQRREVRRLVLTASGGPFRDSTTAEMERASVADAMRHPTWTMGAKITVDSATLMNKGLEVIEAHWLFGFSADEIAVVIHPESVVHSFVELVDGSVIAQMGVTDMRHAIQYALTFPERRASALPSLDLTRTGALTFHQPDLTRFPALALAYQALRTGGTLPACLNAANESAVTAFLANRICLTDIPAIVANVMDAHDAQPATTLERVLAADCLARAQVEDAVTALLATRNRAERTPAATAAASDSLS
jgi:1-deoxy-D-xylulose-5-phosphate reductoisomerase